MNFHYTLLSINELRHENMNTVGSAATHSRTGSSNPSHARENHRGSGRRLLALDTVRGLAVIGMFLQHFALNERNAFVAENTTLLFILCGGISYSIMAQRMKERGTACFYCVCFFD